jgi:peptide/nickel transport system substrate-binding protein
MVFVMAVSCGNKDTTNGGTTNGGTTGGGTTGGGTTDDSKVTTLVVAYDPFSSKFSPFFAQTSYDQDVEAMTQVALITVDRGGNLILNGIEGETNNYNGTDYTYYGIANITVTQHNGTGEDGSVDYTITIRDDIKFSDGTPMTIDDVIFSMYVLADPTYDGSSTFYSLPIEGMEDYRNDSGYEWKGILSDLAAGKDTSNSQYYTAEEAAKFNTVFSKAGAAFAQSIVDYVAANYLSDAYVASVFGSDVTAAQVQASEGLTTAFGMAMWGYGSVEEGSFVCGSNSWDLTTTFPTAADYWNAIFAAYGYNLSADDGINVEAATSSFEDLFEAAATAEGATSLLDFVQLGESVGNIKGITKTGTYSMNVHTTEFSTATIYQLGIEVAPLHYYGSTSLYNYDANQFGFTKGDLSSVKAKTTTPLGAGAYKFESYENGIVTFSANEYYWKGCPKINYLKFVETLSNDDKLTNIISGSVDASTPSVTTEMLETIMDANGGNALTGSVITYYSVDFNGYGYIGINADLVKVGDDKASDASKDLRKAIATLLAVGREVAINSYYGDRASIINYPISNVSWAAPQPTDDGYEVAYSKDVNGNSIYTSSMTTAQKTAAALDAAVGYLKAAGYTWDEATGKFTAAPAGASLSYTFTIPGSGTGDHPSYAIATSTSTLLASIGITLQVDDVSGTEWNNRLTSNTAAIWAGAWGATIDPDMYQIYHSADASSSNHYRIADAELDALIMQARTSANNTYRKTLYKQCFDIILDWAVEIPIYQRQDCYTLSTQRINISTVTPDVTTNWSWMSEIEKLEMN